MPISDRDCAHLMLDTIPHAMRSFAHDMRGVPTVGQGTMPQYRILGHLKMNGQETMGRLAEKHGVTLPTMTKIVAGLVDKGLIEREADERDRRIVRLRLTNDGETMFAEAHAWMEGRLATLLATLTDEERDALAMGLRALRRAFQTAAPPTIRPEEPVQDTPAACLPT